MRYGNGKANISEEISEKPKRGRPVVMPEEWEKLMTGLGMFTDIHSRRGRVNKWYMAHAMSVLMDESQKIPGRYAWLHDEATQRIRSTILTELGRIEDDALLIAMAGELCNHKPHTKDAVAMIRRVRRVNRKKGSALALADEIIDVLNHYVQRFPDMTHNDTERALNIAMHMVERARAKPGADEDSTA